MVFLDVIYNTYVSCLDQRQRLVLFILRQTFIKDCDCLKLFDLDCSRGSYAIVYLISCQIIKFGRSFLAFERCLPILLQCSFRRRLSHRLNYGSQLVLIFNRLFLDSVGICVFICWLESCLLIISLCGRHIRLVFYVHCLFWVQTLVQYFTSWMLRIFLFCARLIEQRIVSRLEILSLPALPYVANPFKL
jgi:hypothetical protein